MPCMEFCALFWNEYVNCRLIWRANELPSGSRTAIRNRLNRTENRRTWLASYGSNKTKGLMTILEGVGQMEAGTINSSRYWLVYWEWGGEWGMGCGGHAALIHYLLLFLPACMCFFCRAREFWNQTCVTRLLRPVTEAMRSKSWPSGLLSIWKLACSTCNCSSVKVVRTRFVLLLW